ncbi:putative kinase [Rhypophila decipiens]
MAAPDAPLQSRVVDDKSPICIPFILSQLEAHKQKQSSRAEGGQPPRPFIIGLNGVQGVGKTTLVRALAQTLQERQGLPTLVLSIDDFYLTHADQLALAAAHPDNALVQYRGEPGTHDIPLALSTFTSLLSSQPTHIPQYDKSAYSGLGDRLPPSQWKPVNQTPENPTSLIKVIILEGWLIGFRPLSPDALQARWSTPSPNTKTLHKHTIDSLSFINENLRKYDALTDLLDAFIHIDAEDLSWVYDWRLEQESQLRKETGSGMTDEQVVRFVDGYYPAYELYGDGVREGVFKGDESKRGHQLRLVVGRDRSVQWKEVI